MSGCRNCSGRLFHSIGPAVAIQQSPNWLRYLLNDKNTLNKLCTNDKKVDVTVTVIILMFVTENVHTA